MKDAKKRPLLDHFRVAAALLVLVIHTSPLAAWTAAGDFWLARIFARLAVPFFFMTSGYFLAQNNWRSIGHALKKSGVLYAVSILLYLPLNLHAGQLGSLPDILRRLFADGTFYHLWYFPAILLGMVLAWRLSRLGAVPAFAIAGILYLAGLGGDSYYGLAAEVPALKTFYAFVFQIASYTRNGLFFAPVFFLIGAAGRQWSRRVSWAGFLLSLTAMSAEGFWLRRLDVSRHDSMYLFLPLCMAFLFSLLLSGNQGEDRTARRFSVLLFILHLWCIAVARTLAARTLGEAVADNGLFQFCAALGMTIFAWKLLAYWEPPRSNARAWREIDAAALACNAAVLQAALPEGCALMAVLKADAYGHGAIPAARCLRKAGVRAFAVACLSEGIALRRAGIRGTILILGWTPPEDARQLRRWHLTQTVADAAHGRALSAQKQRLHVHLALDTGMNRLGVSAGDREAIAELYRLPGLRIDGVFSHLAVSDSLDPESEVYTAQQLQRFYQTIDWMRSAGLDPGSVHIQASYGLWNLPEQPCQYARTGIALYGVQSGGEEVRRKLDLRPVLSLRARVVHLQTLEAGETAGYGRAFQAERKTRLAVVSIGYADGLPRDLPQRGGEVLLHGRRCPMVGRMCMDQLFVDVTGAEAAPGDVATLLGRDGGEAITAEALAAQCGTITNELLSRLGPRLGLRFNPRRSNPPASSASNPLS
jgi:serine/alanine racemase